MGLAILVAIVPLGMRLANPAICGTATAAYDC